VVALPEELLRAGKGLKAAGPGRAVITERSDGVRNQQEQQQQHSTAKQRVRTKRGWTACGMSPLYDTDEYPLFGSAAV
jgi:hypothetical protein